MGGRRGVSRAPVWTHPGWACDLRRTHGQGLLPYWQFVWNYFQNGPNCCFSSARVEGSPTSTPSRLLSWVQIWMMPDRHSVFNRLGGGAGWRPSTDTQTADGPRKVNSCVELVTLVEGGKNGESSEWEGLASSLSFCFYDPSGSHLCWHGWAFTIVLKELQAVWKKFHPPPSLSLFYWKAGVGASLIVEHLSSSQLQRQGQLGDLWQHLPDGKPSDMSLLVQRALAWIRRCKKRWSDGLEIHAHGISHPGRRTPAHMIWSYEAADDLRTILADLILKDKKTKIIL